MGFDFFNGIKNQEIRTVFRYSKKINVILHKIWRFQF